MASVSAFDLSKQAKLTIKIENDFSLLMKFPDWMDLNLTKKP